MGWSCSKRAGDTLDIISDVCFHYFAVQNMFYFNGKEHFWEVSNREYDDGAITGGVYVEFGRYYKRVGSFRIDGMGEIVRFSFLPRNLRREIELKR